MSNQMQNTRERAEALIDWLERRSEHFRRCAQTTDNQDARGYFASYADDADEFVKTVRTLLSEVKP